LFDFYSPMVESAACRRPDLRGGVWPRLAAVLPDRARHQPRPEYDEAEGCDSTDDLERAV
jgi:hypothetical protein